jgi:hypothetical protein
MLRRNSLQTHGLAGAKTGAELLEEAVEIESLRAAYFLVSGHSGRVVSGSAMKKALRDLKSNATPGPVIPAAKNTSQIPCADAPQRASELPFQALNLLPIDAAIETISRAEYEQTINLRRASISPQPISAKNPEPFDIASTLRRQYDPKNSVNLSATESPETECLPASPTRVEPQNLSRPGGKRKETFKFSETGASSRHIAQPVGHSTTTNAPTAQPKTVSRPLTLPRFLMETPEKKVSQPIVSDFSKSAPLQSVQKLSPSPADAIPTDDTSQSGKKIAFAVELDALRQNAQNNLPPMPQELFDDLFTNNPVGPKPAASARPLDKNKAVPLTISRMKPAAAHLSDMEVNPMDDQSVWASQYQQYESVWAKLFERPRLLLGVLGLGIVSCSIYIALGYWCFGNSPSSQAAEPLTMLNLKDSAQNEGDNPTSTFNNIRSIQQNAPDDAAPSSLKPTGKPTGVLLAQADPMGGFSAAAPLPATKMPVKYEPTGRVDPFAPLVSGASTSTDADSKKPEEIKKDILADVQYTGFIGDINSRDKVALIKVVDTVSGISKTMIKKVGQALSINGERVVLRAISKKTLYLSIQGESRQLGIQQYQATKPVPSAPGAGPSAAGAPGAAAGAMSGATGSANPAQPMLNEPKG